MSWLWLLWPLAGLLAWAWLHHMVYRFAYHTAMTKVTAIFVFMALSPFMAILACVVAPVIPPKHRWGLRFW
jgi:hypothetical protein